MTATAGRADRSTLNAVTGNLDTGDVADPALRLAFFQYMTDLSDANYDYTAGLISAGTLSRLGIINVKDYNASGDGDTTTTGSITSGSKALTVASTSTFAQGQGISVAGAGAAGVDLVTTIASISGLVVNLVDAAGTTVSSATVSHNDTVAIQAAIDAADTSSGGIIQLPKGTYNVTSLTLCSKLILQGAGRGVTVFKTIGVQTNVFSAEAKDKIRLSDFEIDGNSMQGSVGVYFGSVTNFVIENLYIHDLGTMNTPPTTDTGYAGTGISIDANNGSGSYYGIVRYCHVERIAGGGNRGDGIYIGGNNVGSVNSHHITVTNCVVSTVGRHAYCVAGTATSQGQHITFRDNYGEKTALAGTDIELGTYIAIDNCHYSACGNDQTYFDPETEYGTGFGLMRGVSLANGESNIDIIGCKFLSCYGAISAGSTDNVRILNNQSLNSNSPSGYGDFHLYAGSGITNSIIKGNIIESPAQMGIRLSVSTNVIIRDNTILSAGNHGMEVDGSTEIEISGNVIVGCAGTGIRNTSDYVQIMGNRVKNNTRGIHNRTSSPNSLLNLIVSDNRCWDDQGTQTQDYGLYFEQTTGTIDYVLCYGNNVRGNINAMPAIPGANSVNVNNLT